MLVDLHAHYPMHLVPGEGGAHARLNPSAWPSERARAWIVDRISRLANYQGPCGGPGVTVELMRKGHVGVVLSVLYQPFDEMGAGYRDPPNPAYFEHLMDQLKLVETHVAEHPHARMVGSAAELDQCVADGLIAIVHAVEGAFHLGDNENDIRAHVGKLARRGVRYITVAHLFWRQVATNAPAIPFLPDWLYELVFHQPRDEGLSPLGRAAVEAMIEHRVLVDISHMSEASLADTFELLHDSGQPVLATHMACRCGRLAYNLTDDTIRQVAELGGVLGVIDCQHYVADGLRCPRRSRSFKDAVELVCTHINRIHRVTKSFDHAAIGSDLDGYIKPALSGIQHMGHMHKLQTALETYYGPTVAHKVCRENAMAVLRAGWAS
jgi:microsomal dipeptidase-like Zn-dependent dipeptidase